jgi:FixJ family two-component response regulator
VALAGGLPECLIVDWQMPEMNGVELLEHLTSRGVRVPTIIISAHDNADARERYTCAGAVAFLAKTLQDVELLAAVSAAQDIASKLRGRRRP